MYRPHFGRKKLSQNRVKFSPRLTYTPQKPKNRCGARENRKEKLSDLAIQSSHKDENASSRGEEK